MVKYRGAKDLLEVRCAYNGVTWLNFMDVSLESPFKDLLGGVQVSEEDSGLDFVIAHKDIPMVAGALLEAWSDYEIALAEQNLNGGTL